MNWASFALGACTWLILGPILGIAAGVWLRHSRHAATTAAVDQALALTKPPPRPAPNPPRAGSRAAAGPPRHGGIAYSVRTWRCGRIRIWDHNGQVIYRHDCACPPPDPWDVALRDLTTERPIQ